MIGLYWWLREFVAMLLESPTHADEPSDTS